MCEMSKGKVVTRAIRMWAAGLTGLFIMSIMGCFAAIPVAIWYYEKDQNYVATAQVPLPVDQIYKNALKRAEESKDKGVKIVKTDEAKHLIEVTDGVQTATFEAKELDAKNSIFTVMANVPEKKGVKEAKEVKKEAEKELALRIVNNLCEASNVKCTIIKKENEKEGEGKK
jgi:hypothetical protein